MTEPRKEVPPGDRAATPSRKEPFRFRVGLARSAVILGILIAVVGGCRGKTAERDDAATAGDSLHTPEGAVADAWENAKQRGMEYRALGEEPGWYLEIDDGNRIALVADYGEKQVETPAPAPERAADGTVTYRVETDAHRLTVLIQPDSCWDSMSGAGFPNTVTVTLDSTEYKGCGKPV